MENDRYLSLLIIARGELKEALEISGENLVFEMIKVLDRLIYQAGKEREESRINYRMD